MNDHDKYIYNNAILDAADVARNMQQKLAEELRGSQYVGALDSFVAIKKLIK